MRALLAWRNRLSRNLRDKNKQNKTFVRWRQIKTLAERENQRMYLDPLLALLYPFIRLSVSISVRWLCYVSECIWIYVLTGIHTLYLLYITYTPVCVKGRNGLPSTWVLWPCLLQQDVLHQPCDVYIDVAWEAVQTGCIGCYPHQEFWGTGYLPGGLIVIGHSHDDSGETCLTNVSKPIAGPEWTQMGPLKLVKRAMVAWH